MPHVTIGTMTSALFGEGVRHELSRVINTSSKTHVLIIASESALKRPKIAILAAQLQDLCKVSLWKQVRPNPRLSDIRACRMQYQAQGVTHIVGIGGGSALDQAKATAMALHCDSDLTGLLASKTPLPQRTNQLVLLPTTSGTGSELSYGAILTDEQSGEKLGLRGRCLAADHALVDPELTWDTPTDVSRVTGFDVLTHALETWLSSEATPYTRDLSRGALERVFRWLPVIQSAPENKLARRELSYASMIMGINLALSTTCLPHRMQYPIGAATDTAHAAGLAAIYPAWLEHLLPHAEEKLADCADWIAPVWELPTVTNQKERAIAFVGAVHQLMEVIGLTPSLQQLGITKDMASKLHLEVKGRLDTDPCYQSLDDMLHIYQRAFTS